jgi:hypothetical protein
MTNDLTQRAAGVCPPLFLHFRPIPLPFFRIVWKSPIVTDTPPDHVLDYFSFPLYNLHEIGWVVFSLQNYVSTDCQNDVPKNLGLTPRRSR